MFGTKCFWYYATGKNRHEKANEKVRAIREW